MTEPISFSVTYDGCSRDILSSSDKPSEIRRLFNSQVDTAVARDKDSSDGHSSWKSIPTLYRAWMQSIDGRWLEIFDQDGFREMLSDSSLKHPNNVRRIQFRSEKDPSPNTTPTLKPVLSPRTFTYTPLEIHQLGPSPVNSSCPLSLDNIQDLEAKERVMVWNYQTGAPIKSLLLSVTMVFEFIKSEFSKGKSLFEVQIRGRDDTADCEVIVQCTRFVWGILTSKTYCPLANEFEELLMEFLFRVPANQEAFDAIKNDRSGLYSRIQFFVYDLVMFSTGQENLERFIGVDDMKFTQLFLSSFYFSQSEMELIAHFPLPNGQTLAENINELTSNVHKSLTSDGRTQHVCSSHDIAPIYRRAFHLDHKFYDSSAFTKDYKAFVKERNKQMKHEEKRIKSESLAATKPSTSSRPTVDMNDEKVVAAFAEMKLLDEKITNLGDDDKAQAQKSKWQKQKARLSAKYGLS